MATNTPGFSAADYIIFATTIAISIGIGFFHAVTGGKQKTASEYLVGNRKMSIVPVTLSLIVSFESSIMMLAYPAEVYTYGIMFVLSSIGFMLATLLATRIVVPLIHPLKITSVYEYLELRYNSKAVRLLGTILGTLYSVILQGWGAKDYHLFIGFKIIRCDRRIEVLPLFEKYLTWNNYSQKKITTKFRISAHDLEIERGDTLYTGLNPIDRKCRLCKNDIEDECDFF